MNLRFLLYIKIFLSRIKYKIQAGLQRDVAMAALEKSVGPKPMNALKR